MKLRSTTFVQPDFRTIRRCCHADQFQLFAFTPSTRPTAKAPMNSSAKAAETSMHLASTSASHCGAAASLLDQS